MSKNFFIEGSLLTAVIFLLSACDKDAPEEPALLPEGIEIGGVEWAASNVESPGTFAALPANPGMLYIWDSPVGWEPVGDVSGWQETVSSNTTWQAANDPCPLGWRLPTKAELEILANSPYRRVDTPVKGTWFANTQEDADNGTEGKAIFLPAVGQRMLNDGDLTGINSGYYWSSEQYDDNNGSGLFMESQITIGSDVKSYGFSLRCVVDK
jgi:uncharacterized protein (TIGR02145 family)